MIYGAFCQYFSDIGIPSLSLIQDSSTIVVVSSAMTLEKRKKGGSLNSQLYPANVGTYRTPPYIEPGLAPCYLLR